MCVEHPPRSESRLASLLDSLFHSVPITPDVREWLIKALIHYLRHGGNAPLDRFLGLAPINSGERSLSTRLGMLKRDIALVDALEKIALDETITDWGRCVRLERELPEFEAHAWKLYRHSQEPLERWPAWQQSLFNAYKTGYSIPRTAQSLHEILKRAKGYSFGSAEFKLLTSLTRIQSNEKILVRDQGLSE